MPDNIQYFSGYLIPKIHSPYRLHSEKEKESLQNSILNGKVGDRTPYPCIKPINIEKSSSAFFSQKSYKITKIPIEKQIAYDKQLLLKCAEKTAPDQTYLNNSNIQLTKIPIEKQIAYDKQLLLKCAEKTAPDQTYLNNSNIQLILKLSLISVVLYFVLKLSLIHI